MAPPKLVDIAHASVVHPRSFAAFSPSLVRGSSSSEADVRCTSGGKHPQMQLRRSLALLFALGSPGCPVGMFAFGGFDTGTGAAVIGTGCLLVLVSLAAELVLRARDDRRRRRPAGK